MNEQLHPREPVIILNFAAKCLSLDGDFVELGCYRGDTSVLLAQLLKNSPTSVKPVENSRNSVEKSVDKIVENPVENPQTTPQSKRLWIYDSFAGLPAKTPEDASGAGANFQEGALLVSKREVIDKLRKHGLKNVIVKKAWFNELTSVDLPNKIAFAFCDGDLYSSIKTSLNLILPRLVEQGIIAVHDYNNPELPGSARAVDEFLRLHPDFRLEVRETLALLTKVC